MSVIIDVCHVCHAENGVLYNFATTFSSIMVEFCGCSCCMLYGAVIRALQACVAYLMTIVQSKLARPSFISPAHCSENLGETSRPAPPTKGEGGKKRVPKMCPKKLDQPRPRKGEGRGLNQRPSEEKAACFNFRHIHVDVAISEK